jgi:hypothetical protein
MNLSLARRAGTILLPGPEYFEMTDVPEERQQLKADHVYLDASVYRSLQFDWDGRWLSALADLVDRGLTRVVITDITKREVASLMREVWSEANKSVQRSAIALGQMGLVDAIASLGDEETCIAKMQAGFEKWLRRVNAWTCKYDADLSTILDDYFEGKPPFGPGKKKSEFPDAIVTAVLRSWCATTKQSVYVVAEDGDLRACCTQDGPLIYATSVKEVISHGTASVKVHDAVSAAVRDSEWFLHAMQCEVADLSVEVEIGYRNGAEIEVQVESLKLEEMSVDEVVVLDFDGSHMTCVVYLTNDVAMRVRVEQEPVQYSADVWDPGFHHTSWISVTLDLTATVKATLADDGSVELEGVQLDDNHISLPWRNIERIID